MQLNCVKIEILLKLRTINKNNMYLKFQQWKNAFQYNRNELTICEKSFVKVEDVFQLRDAVQNF